MDWLIVWLLMCCLFGRVIGWLLVCLCWLDSSVFDCTFDCLIGWLVDMCTVWLVGWLVGCRLLRQNLAWLGANVINCSVISCLFDCLVRRFIYQFVVLLLAWLVGWSIISLFARLIVSFDIFDWSVVWFVGCTVGGWDEWLIDGLFDSRIVLDCFWLFCWCRRAFLIGRSDDVLFVFFFDCSVVWSLICWIACFVGRLIIQWLTCWFVGRSNPIDCRIGWLVGWMVGWYVGCLVVWLLAFWVDVWFRCRSFEWMFCWLVVWFLG